jgi:hypothetical protein
MRLSAVVLTLLVCGTSFAEPKRGESCDEDNVCPAGLSCVHYKGIRGDSGPELSTCERRCSMRRHNCPEGEACVNVADGPGSVCMTTNRKPKPPKTGEHPKPAGGDHAAPTSADRPAPTSGHPPNPESDHRPTAPPGHSPPDHGGSTIEK